LDKGVVRLLAPFAGRILRAPAEVLDALRKLDESTAELRATLSDPEVSSYRVVVIPEKMVMREAERAISYLGLFNYPVDSVVINRVIPDLADAGDFLVRRREVQAKYLELIENNFSPLPLWTAPYYAEEVFGLEPLSRLAHDCFEEEDPGQIFYRGSLQEIIELEDGRYLLRLRMPFVKSSDVKLRKRGDELFITIGNFKREMILPTVLAKMRAGGGRLIDGQLEVEFITVSQAELMEQAESNGA
jgi:arsenite-transporting ATPase